MPLLDCPCGPDCDDCPPGCCRTGWAGRRETGQAPPVSPASALSW